MVPEGAANGFPQVAAGDVARATLPFRWKGVPMPILTAAQRARLAEQEDATYNHWRLFAGLRMKRNWPARSC